MVISPFIFLIIFISTVVSIVIALVIQQSRGLSASLKTASVELGAEGSKDGFFEGVLEGQDYKYQYFEGSKNSPPSLLIRARFDSGATFKIEKENSFDRLFQGLGYSMEIKTGDADFDRKFYIACERQDFMEAYLTAPERRRVILDLMAEGFKVIEVSKRMISLTKSPFSLPESGLPDIVMNVVRKVKVLTTDLPPIDCTDRPAGLIPHAAVSRFFFWGSALALGAAIISWLWAGRFLPWDGWKCFGFSLRFSIPCLAAYLWVAGYLLKGKSDSHRVLASVFGLSLPAFLAGGMALCVWVNGSMDPSPIQYQSALVAKKYTTRHKSSTYYHVQIDSWRPRIAFEKLSVGRDDYPSIIVGKSRVMVETKSGRLGFEWEVRHYLLPTEKL